MSGNISRIFDTYHEELVEGSKLNGVTCEQCGFQYAYLLTRTGQGIYRRSLGLFQIESDRLAAEQTAKHNLFEKLRWDLDIVPCPKCEWVQSDMVDEFRSHLNGRLRWATFIGIIFMATGALSLLFQLNYMSIGGFAIGIGLLIFRWLRYAGYDINNHHHVRNTYLEMAKQYTCSREELEETARRNSGIEISDALLDWARQELD